MLSMDSGAFTMNYNNYHQSTSQGNLGIAGMGYASRGKAQNIRRINVMTPQSAMFEQDNASIPTPRSSSRAQLLSGLRTAPKTPTTASTPVNEQPNVLAAGFDSTRYLTNDRTNIGNFAPKTARSLGLAGLRNSGVQQPQAYSRSSPPPTQQQPTTMPAVNTQTYGNIGSLSSTSSPISLGMSDQDNDAKIYAELLAQNIYLAQQQQMLQQQMRNVQQAQQLAQVQQQFQQVSLQSPMSANFNTPMSPAMYLQGASSYQNPQYYQVYNPMTGQSQYVLAQQQQNYAQVPAQPHKVEESVMAAYVAEEPKETKQELKQQQAPRSLRRSPSPPKHASEKTPTPPPAFRRGHKKSTSLSIKAHPVDLKDNGPKTSVPTTGIPSTPMNSTFGGKGEHPVRQPRGPPNLEEIIAKPTAKHEGSKNFVARQRRRAVFKLMHARRAGPRSAVSNGDSMASLSESEACTNFDDSDSATSSHSGRHSSQSMHNDGEYSASSVSGDEGMSAKMAASQAKIVAETRKMNPAISAIRNSTDKRRSALF